MMSKEETERRHQEEIQAHMKRLEGTEPGDMNNHDLVLFATITKNKLEEARGEVQAAMDNIPAAAKMAAGSQLAAVHRLLDAQSEMLLATFAMITRIHVGQD